MAAVDLTPIDDQPPRIGGLRGFLALAFRFFPFALPYWDKLLLRILYKQANALIGILGAAATIRIIDGGILAGDARTFFIWSAIKIVLTAHILVHITIYANIFHYVNFRLNLKFKRLMFDHVQRMMLRFHQKRPIGENMYRVNSDTEAATDFGANAVLEPVERVVEIATYAGLLVALNPTVAALLGAYLGAYFLYSHFIVGKMYLAQQHMRRAEQAVSALLQEIYSAFAASKSFSRERTERRRYLRRLARVMRTRFRFFGWLAAWMEGGDLIREVLIVQVAHLGFCGWLVITGKLTLGEFLAIMEMINLVSGPLIALIATIQRLRVAAVPAQRMLETLDFVPSVLDAPGAPDMAAPQGEIRFENVRYAYTEGGRDVLHDLSFTIQPGRKTAIVGVSGAGKTSIFNLLMRYADPHSGRVLVDGHDLKQIRRDSYIRHVGIVLQENFLFSATIRDNLLIGNPDADEEQLQRAIELAGLGPTIDALPDGLDTMLLEGGNLSAGQKQRIGIARAVLRDPKFLFLDEATSSLDPATEKEILAQLRKVEAGRTVLVIAHHLNTVRTADEIIVMEDGRLAQQGRHEDLIKDDEGAYARLWRAEESKHSGPAGKGAP